MLLPCALVGRKYDGSKHLVQIHHLCYPNNASSLVRSGIHNKVIQGCAGLFDALVSGEAIRPTEIRYSAPVSGELTSSNKQCVNCDM